MNSPEQPSPTAQEAYEQRYAEVGELLIRIATKVEADHDAPEPKHWGHVGNLGHVAVVLRDVAEFLQA